MRNRRKADVVVKKYIYRRKRKVYWRNAERKIIIRGRKDQNSEGGVQFFVQVEIITLLFAMMVNVVVNYPKRGGRSQGSERKKSNEID